MFKLVFMIAALALIAATMNFADAHGIVLYFIFFFILNFYFYCELFKLII